MTRPTIYVSVDVEADGPVPGLFSLRSIGAAAYEENGNMIDTFYENLLPDHRASEYQPTIDWFQIKHPEAWRALLEDADYPEKVMRRFYSWIISLPGKPVFIGAPVAFDHPFVHWNFWKYIGDDPFSHSGIDEKTMAWVALGGSYREIGKREYPERWFNPELQHTHKALDDAIEQGYIFFQIKKDLEDMRYKAKKYDELMNKMIQPGIPDRNGNIYSVGLVPFSEKI